MSISTNSTISSNAILLSFLLILTLASNQSTNSTPFLNTQPTLTHYSANHYLSAISYSTRNSNLTSLTADLLFPAAFSSFLITPSVISHAIPLSHSSLKLSLLSINLSSPSSNPPFSLVSLLHHAILPLIARFYFTISYALLQVSLMSPTNSSFGSQSPSFYHPSKQLAMLDS